MKTTRPRSLVKTAILRAARGTGLFQYAARASRGRLRILCYHSFGDGDESAFRPKLFMRSATFRHRMQWLTDNAFSVLKLKGGRRRADDRRPPVLRCGPGQIERRTHDYTRHGTTTLFAALNTTSGKVISEFHRRQRARELRKFLDTIHARVPAMLDVHLILDNSSTHKTPRDPSLAGPPSSLPPALHADVGLLDESRRTLVRRAHREATASRCPPQHPRTRDGHPLVRGDHQRTSQAVRVDEDRRRDPLKHRSLWHRISDSGH
jgi:hypothetical protein